ncbi:hypothetical protein PIB30_016246 [Stylosanthes scabra]|uniref:Uncharacterized protein n=1 Tax=Stylosanthes scabra TaxID=79078 RepID=A0ABU6Y920_9FABA|nr:hypothetical protein [Stylosanthes scabra]
MSSSSQQAFLAGLSSPEFQRFISDMLHDGDGGYRPDTQFDGFQVHLDLNEPVSGPSHVFMALDGTPPSAAHVPGGSWEVPFMKHARLPIPPASPALAEQLDEPAARGAGPQGSTSSRVRHRRPYVVFLRSENRTGHRTVRAID